MVQTLRCRLQTLRVLSGILGGVLRKGGFVGTRWHVHLIGAWIEIFEVSDIMVLLVHFLLFTVIWKHHHMLFFHKVLRAKRHTDFENL